MNPENLAAPASAAPSQNPPAESSPVVPPDAQIADSGSPTSASGDAITTSQVPIAPPETVVAPQLVPEVVAAPVASAEGTPDAPAQVAPQSSATAALSGVNAPAQVAPAPASEASSPTSEAPSPSENPALSVSFSPTPDAPFQSSLTLQLSCVSPTAKIHYALGGKDVDEDGLLFDPNDKIFLTQTTLVTARAFEGNQAGPLARGRFEVQKSLWQEVEPSDQSDAVPHKASDNLACEDGWTQSAASVRGKLHAHRGLWREDSFALGTVEGGSSPWQIAVVSDGAGSASLSRVGSRAACEGAMGSLRASLSQMGELADEQETLAKCDLPVLREALVQSGVAALDAIRVQAQERGKPLTAFAATLLVLLRRQWNGAQLCAALQVGDGSIALWDEKGLTLLGDADHGEHSSETRFLTTNGVEADLPSRVKFSIKAGLRAFAVMSDGVSDDYFPEEKRLGEVFEALEAPLQSESDGGAALLQWLGYEKKGSSDDRTLLIGWKTAPSGNELSSAAPNANAATANSIQATDAPSANVSAEIATPTAPALLEQSPVAAETAAPIVPSTASSAETSAQPTVTAPIIAAPSDAASASFSIADSASATSGTNAMNEAPSAATPGFGQPTEARDGDSNRDA